MSRHFNFVCCDCRTVSRGSYYSQRRCPDCGRDMLRTGGRNRIPKKTDRKGWRDLIRRLKRLFR